MIKKLIECNNNGHDVSIMFTCAGNWVFEHYIEGKLEFDMIESDYELFESIVNRYLCELKDMK